MTKEDQASEIGATFLALKEAKQELNCLRSRMFRYANDLERMANILRGQKKDAPESLCTKDDAMALIGQIAEAKVRVDELQTRYDQF